jgi:hypothetical protein
MKYQQMQQLFIQFIMYGRSYMFRHYIATHNILSTAPQLNISQKALGTLPEDSNVMPKHVEPTMHN